MDRLMTRYRRVAMVALVALAMAGASACVAKTLRDRAQVSALSIADAVSAFDQAEIELYASGAYGPAEHDQVSLALARTARLGQAYTRAVAEWPENADDNIPVTVNAAAAAFRASLDTLAKSFPQAAEAQKVLGQALVVIRQALDLLQRQQARLHGVEDIPVSGAELPVGFGLNQTLIALSFAMKLVEMLRNRAKQEGATPEQLAAAEKTLGDIADRRESELGG